MKYSETTTLDLLKGCDYIVARAQAGQNTIGVIGCLVFIAHEGGDAFALDVEDKFACPLCEEATCNAMWRTLQCAAAASAGPTIRAEFPDLKN